MKKIKDFNDLKISKNQSSVITGSNTTKTRFYGEEIDEDGCCRTYTTHDSFDDCNDNGLWDSDESGTATTTSIDCVE